MAGAALPKVWGRTYNLFGVKAAPCVNGDGWWWSNGALTEHWPESPADLDDKHVAQIQEAIRAVAEAVAAGGTIPLSEPIGTYHADTWLDDTAVLFKLPNGEETGVLRWYWEYITVVRGMTVLAITGWSQKAWPLAVVLGDGTLRGCIMPVLTPEQSRRREQGMWTPEAFPVRRADVAH